MSENLNKKLRNFEGFKINLNKDIIKENKIISFIKNNEFFLRATPKPDYEWCKGERPLHIAIRKKYPYNVILALLERCPESARIKTNNGKLPLHYALEYLYQNNQMKKYYEDFIIKLIDVYPEGVKELLINGINTLYWALKNNFSLKIISKLLEISPDQIKTKIYDQYPLIVAISWYQTDDVIIYLLEKYPDAAKEPFEYGKKQTYAFQLAIKNKYSKIVTDKLRETYPGANNKLYELLDSNNYN